MKLLPPYVIPYINIIFCVAIASATLYAYIQKQNEITALRLMIPIATKELKAIQEENVYLRYQIQSFENPQNLLQYTKDPQYGHLRYPRGNEVLILNRQPALE